MPTKFSSFLNEQYLPNDFKDFEWAAGYIDKDGLRGKFIDSLRFLEQAITDGQAWNTDFQTHYYGLTRGLEYSYGKVHEKYYNVFRENEKGPFSEDTDSLFSINSLIL